jgi:hypothetical protein
MTAYTYPPESFSSRFEEMMDSLQHEFRNAVAYADRVIVPQIRHESGGAVRMLARHLDRLADVLDPDGKQAR